MAVPVRSRVMIGLLDSTGVFPVGVFPVVADVVVASAEQFTLMCCWFLHNWPYCVPTM